MAVTKTKALVVLVVTLCVGQQVSSADPVAITRSGAVRGTILKATKGRDIYAFRGIPFAEPPLGPLRFKDPVPIAPWAGEFDATKDSERCAGPSRSIVTMLGVEDCLKINVYTPKLPPKGTTSTSLPVFFWIHGGAYVGGTASSAMYGPQRLLNKDIVMVSAYYRLGPLGFLNTLDDAAPGNAGLHDQHLALLWVRDNIASFGGDPARITIAGESAGSGSISYHLLSPKSNGLFRAAIMQSGNAMAPWSHEDFPLVKARAMGLTVGCLDFDTTQLVQCLQTKSVQDLVLSPLKIGAAQSFLGFVPSVENRISGAMVIDKPEKLFREGRFSRVPVITGVNADEGMLIFVAFNALLEEAMGSWVYKLAFPEILSKFCNKDLTSELANITPQSGLTSYFLEINILFPAYIVLNSIAEIVSDVSFNAPNDKIVRLLGLYNVPVYMYVLEYIGDTSPKVSGQKVVPHAADLEYLFLMSDQPALSTKDAKVSDQMVEMWANFVTNLDPTPGLLAIPKWTRAYPTAYPDYLSIGNNIFDQPSFDMRHLGYRTAEAFFWNDIFPPFTLP